MQDDDDSNGSFVPAPSKDLELDPFGYPVKKIWTPYEVVKTVLMTLLLVPVLRLLLFYICLYMASRVAKRAISDLNDRTDGDGNIVPLPAERQRILKELSFWSRVGLWLYGFYKIEIKGKLDPKAKVLVSNHSSMIDGLFIFAQVIPSVVAKDDVADMFLFGNILKCIQAIFVDRSDKDAKLSVLNEMKRRVSKPGFPPILIFPEGTTTNQSTLISFKRGAFSLGVPVQPIILE